jgi:Na+/H+ antiporter NhaC
MHYILGFLPVLLFVTLFFCSGLYCSYLGIENAFYQCPPTVAILPALALGWVLYRGSTARRFKAFLDGATHPDIITMCIIFVLAGAFGTVTKAIGSVDATVHCMLSLVPNNFLLIGIFLAAAFVSTAIGTSMGAIATIAPLAAGCALQGAFPISIGMATVVGGAMFGDNLSLISDTTIAAVSSQEADMQKKLLLNAKIAALAGCITVGILLCTQGTPTIITSQPYSLFLLVPYAVLLGLALCKVHVFTALFISIGCAGLVGWYTNGYSILSFSTDISKGFASMHEIMLLSIFVGGLSGLVHTSTQKLADQLLSWISTHGSTRMAQLVIAKLVSVFDLLLANNTIAIVLSGNIARTIATTFRVPAHYSATWLDIFSCVFQGIIPYGAQILLASSVAGISPLSITPHVYYCYALGGVALVWILFKKPHHA